MTAEQQPRSLGVSTLQEALAAFDGTYGNFQDAAIEEVIVGPRREVTLRLRPMLWEGARGKHGPALVVRFGGIREFERVADRFRQIPSLQSELGFLGPDQSSSPRSPARLAFRFEAERREFAFGFSCKSVSITE